MDMNALLERLKAQREQLIIEPEPLKDRLIFRYYQMALNNLIKWVETTPEADRVLSCERLLRDNWTLINGTCLSYTALPDSPLTKIFCELASFVRDSRREEDPSLGIVNLLMPTVSIESLSNNYPHLGPIEEDTHQVWGELDPRTKAKKLISYTTEWTSDPVLDIHFLLKTHVLGREGRFLIPIHLLTLEKAEGMENPYFKALEPLTEEPESASINQDELARLHHHSSLTRSIEEAETRIQLLRSDTSHLLGHLTLLCQHLQFNSVQGVGSETAAGQGVYWAIIQFNEYYNLLDKTEKERIPARIKQAIERLLSLSGDPAQNQNATSTSNIDTCIAMRRNKLGSVMTGSEDTLSQIGLKGAQKGALISEEEARVASLKNQLAGCLKKKEYTEGSDSLGLTQALLKTFKCQITVKDFHEVETLFMDVTPNELSLLLSEPELARRCVLAIGDLSNLVMLCIHLTPERLKVVMDHLSRDLLNMVHSSRDLNSILMFLDVEKSQLIFQSELTKTLITTVTDYSACVHGLSKEQQNMAIKWMKENAVFLIKDPTTMSQILRLIPQEEWWEVIQSCQKKSNFAIDMTIPGLFQLAADIGVPSNTCFKLFLPRLMSTLSDFRNVIHQVKGKDNDLVFDAFKEHFKKQIDTAEAFCNVMSVLTEQQRAMVYETIKPFELGLINTCRDFLVVMAHLTEEQRMVGFKTTLKPLLDKVLTVDELISAMGHLTTAQRSEVFESVKPRLNDLIKTADDFEKLMPYFDLEQRTVVFDAVKDRFHLFDEADRRNLMNSMRHLTSDQKIFLFDLFKNDDFKCVISILRAATICGFLTMLFFSQFDV